MGIIYKMSETSNTKNILSGIYKITFPNNKCYIGLSNNRQYGYNVKRTL